MSFPGLAVVRAGAGGCYFPLARFCCKHETMSAPIPVNAKGRGGRPPGKEFPVSVQLRLTEAQAAILDAWREVQPEKPSRSEAIRRLLTAALDPKA